MPTFETNPDAAHVATDETITINPLENDTVSEGVPYIARINGVDIAPGSIFTLPSGAFVATDLDNLLDTFDRLIYDPNGAFDGIGLSQVTDSFTYEIAVATGLLPYMTSADLEDPARGMVGGVNGAAMGAADLNGDGIADLLSIYFDTAGNNFARVAFMPSGSSDPLTIHGRGGSQNLLSNIVSAGDINGDGIEDVIVDTGRTQSTGEAFVLFGNSAGFGTDFTVTDVNGANGFRIAGDGPGRVGRILAAGGDFDGDGYGELLVSAQDLNQFGVDRVYLVFGKANYSSANFSLANVNGANGTCLVGIDGVQTFSFIGDVNNDGLDDLAVSATDSSHSSNLYVLFGTDGALPAQLDLSTMTSAQGTTLALDVAAPVVSGAGDVNDDGIDDMLLTTGGAVYVVFGAASGFALPSDLSLLDGSNGFKIIDNTLPANRIDDDFGHAASGAGDVNGDGIDDLVLLTEGQAIVVYGSDSGFAAVFGTSAINGSNGFIYENYQPITRLIAGRDINGDGLSDIVLSSGTYSGETRTVSIYGQESSVSFSGPETVQVTVGGNGTEGDDHLIGLDVDETADVLAGNDYVEGRGGNDVLHGNAGNDHLIGGTGNDTLYGEDGADQLAGDAGDDVLDGGNGNNKLVGGTGNDQLVTGNGADTLSGQSGDDQLIGGSGNDVLLGGSGVDRMNGGAGADTFRFLAGDFATNPVHSRDIIAGFSGAAGDRIDLASIDAVAGGGDNAFTFVGDAGFSHVAGELRYQYVNNVTLIQGDWNGDGISDMDIRLSGHIALAAGDFIL